MTRMTMTDTENQLEPDVFAKPSVICRVPERFNGANWSDIDGHNEAKKSAAGYADKVVENHAVGAGWLFIHGKSGSGKTMLAAVLARVCAHKGVRQEWLNTSMLLLKLRDGMKTNTPESDILSEYRRVSLLVLDDLGSEIPTDYSKSSLYILLNDRWEGNRATIITSNLGIKELGKALGSRIADRIFRESAIIKMEGDSWALRQKKGKVGK